MNERVYRADSLLMLAAIRSGRPVGTMGALFWAIHVHLLSWLSPRMDGIKLACAQYAVCALLSLITAGFMEGIAIEGLREALIPIVYGGILSVGVPYTLQVVAQRDAPPTHAAIILSLDAVFVAVAGWLVLDEMLSLPGLIGCIFMFSGMLTTLLIACTGRRSSDSALHASSGHRKRPADHGGPAGHALVEGLTD